MNSLERIIFVVMRNHSRQRTNRFNVILIGMMAAVYLLFSVGIVKATHFCMGREASVSFFTTEAEACACGSAESGMSCCSDEHGLLKLEDSQKHISFLQAGIPVLGLLGEIYARNVDAGINAVRAGKDTSDPPPLQTTLYKLYCKFVFYDD